MVTDNDSTAGSPRTKVAYGFQGLRLEDAGSVGRFELDLPVVQKGGFDSTHFGMDGARDVDMLGEEGVRKRVKVLKKPLREVPETPHQIGRTQERGKQFGIVIGPERVVDPRLKDAAKGVTLSNEVDPVVFRGTPIQRGGSSGMGDLRRAYPSINRLVDSKSRARKMDGNGNTIMPETNIQRGNVDREVNLERSDMTWHDDEITGHDPTDPDDDGEGINGIGFKPTPAEAYSRAQKRKQQMAEYRNREAKEARKMRSERRRGSDISKASKEEEETARRVRFLENEVKGRHVGFGMV